MDREGINQRYARRSGEVATLISAAKRRGRGFFAGEIVTFAAAIGFVAVRTVTGGSWPLWVALACFLLYIMVRRMDVRNDRMTHELEDVAETLRRELQYMAGDFSAFDDGARYGQTSHPFSLDLDIFGPLSLFQRVNRTVTTGGSDLLASRLSSLDYDARRPLAVDELSKGGEFLLSFKARGIRHHVDTDRVAAALQAADELSVSAVFTSRVSLAAIVASVLGLWATIIMAIAGVCSAMLPLWWAIAEFCAMYFLCHGLLCRLGQIVGTLIKEVQAMMALVRLVRDQEFMSEYNQLIHGRLHGALDSFDALDGILRALDRRANLLGNFFQNGLFALDFFTVRKFWHWQQRYQSRFQAWVEAVSEMDALVSMATYARNEQSARWALVLPSAEKVVFEARDLSHPFLGEAAVKNDFAISDRHYYIVTGANMAGKSTFLRAVGISIVMAMAGLPVFATSLTVSRFRLFTSMRTSDDLSHGISYFNAELLRLRQLLSAVGEAGDVPTLIILDEILKGTNSLDKLNGSRLFLEHIARENVTGIIATHDLELSRMAEQDPERFHTRCFEIELGAHVTYSYKITKGVARNQNATFLLRQLLDTK